MDGFKWTKVSLLTPKEAKRARIQFVKENKELHNDPRSLAKALIAEGLYSDTTEPYKIINQVARMIREAGLGD